ncbi:MAG: hypothetical protein AB7N80_15500 [Bdellovibrionales bacterium]
MSHQEVLDGLQSLAQKPVFITAFSHLQRGTELALRLDDRLEFALFRRDHEVCVEERQATADVEFIFSSEALRQLQNHPGEQLASFGIALCEQILAGHIRLRVRGSILKILTGGYLQMILAAGPEFLQFLATHGMTNAAKIMDFMRSLKK